jgi:hypothetical protein
VFNKERETYAFCISSMPRVLFMRLVRPALTPVITAKLRACWNGPPIFNIGLAAAPVNGDGEGERGWVSTEVNDGGERQGEVTVVRTKM